MSHIIITDDEKLILSGNWTLSDTAAIFPVIDKLIIPHKKKVILDAADITLLDSSGALALCRLISKIHSQNKKATFINLKKKHENLLKFTEEHELAIGEPKLESPQQSFLYRVGERTILFLQQTVGYIEFIGQISVIFSQILTLKKSWQWRNTFATLEEVGNNAIPIIMLLMFLVGIVLAYQLGIQLENYGANIFIVNLTGLAVLREFGPLITAIIAAGRTSSSFTAQIGLMKVNEEIDALYVMGLAPLNRIALPKIIAVVLALPLLTLVADAFGVFGSMVMADARLGVSMPDFLARFDDVTKLSSLWTGLSKAPVFGLIIGSVGCYQGFQVQYSSDSIGRQTTKSVVQAIFLVIVADAIFSVLFSMAGI